MRKPDKTKFAERAFQRLSGKYLEYRFGSESDRYTEAREVEIGAFSASLEAARSCLWGFPDSLSTSLREWPRSRSARAKCGVRPVAHSNRVRSAKSADNAGVGSGPLPATVTCE